MLFESFRNEASVSAAWVFFWGFGYLIATLIDLETVHTTPIWDWVIVAAGLLVSTFLIRGGLPSLNGVQYGVLRRSAGSVY